MNILNDLNLNFKTIENSIKTIGTLTILVVGIIYTVSMVVNPVEFTF